MDWSAPIDAYCERSSAAFWAEPLNAVSNLAFILAAIAAAALVRRAAPRDAVAWMLVVLIAVIGVGSFLFHTFATAWAALADVLPITVFIHAYLLIALLRFFRMGTGAAAALTLGFFLASMAVDRAVPPEVLNGSVGYLPALAALLAVGGILSLKGHGAGPAILAVAALFAVSLTARSLDEAVCAALPVGTHWAWHLMNATVLFLLVRALLRHGDARA